MEERVCGAGGSSGLWGVTTVPWREWDDRPAYTAVQSVVNIGLMFVSGAGVVKSGVHGAKGAASAARAGRGTGAAAGAADELAGAASAAGRAAFPRSARSRRPRACGDPRPRAL